MSKYGNVRSSYGGQVYDSRQEAAYARLLDLRRAAGDVRAWERGAAWTLLDAPRARDRITYRPDFHVWDAAGALSVVDVKGYATAVWRLKAKLWRAAYPDIPLIVASSDGREAAA